MAQKYGRKLAITGRSMRENHKTATELGYLDIPEELLIDIGQANNLPGHEVAIMATGSQGEPNAVLGRLAFNRHRSLGIRKGDTIVLSAHTIPGNEEGIHRIVNRLFHKGANVLYEENAKVHVSGHASREEMKLMINLVRPRFFIPVHGELRHLVAHGQLAASLGIPEENIAVVENGTPVEMDQHSMTVLDRLPGGYVFVDGAGVGDIGWSVMRDREKLADNGFFVAVVAVDDDDNLRGRPQMITRGFANLKEMPNLMAGAEEAVIQAVESYGNQRQTLTARVEEALSRYLYAETGRRPMVYAIVT
jgi:ribonuclease J